MGLHKQAVLEQGQAQYRQDQRVEDHQQSVPVSPVKDVDHDEDCCIRLECDGQSQEDCAGFVLLSCIGKGEQEEARENKQVEIGPVHGKKNRVCQEHDGEKRPAIGEK